MVTLSRRIRRPGSSPKNGYVLKHMYTATPCSSSIAYSSGPSCVRNANWKSLAPLFRRAGGRTKLVAPAHALLSHQLVHSHLIDDYVHLRCASECVLICDSCPMSLKSMFATRPTLSHFSRSEE